jgi:probable rRNA maturation factor
LFLQTVIILETAMDGVSQQALARFATRAQKLAGVFGDVAVLITGRREIQRLNRRFRHKNKSTDVLSFPREEGGDIAICAEIAQSNAQRFGHSATSEVKVLILHGMLHLAGYDHETDNGRMEKKEEQLRAQLKLPASLIDRTLNQQPLNQRTLNGPATKNSRKAVMKPARRSNSKKQSGSAAPASDRERGAVANKKARA